MKYPSQSLRPKFGDEFFFCTMDGRVSASLWSDDPRDQGMFYFGNCFPTLEKARKAANMIQELLIDFSEESCGVKS